MRIKLNLIQLVGLISFSCFSQKVIVTEELTNKPVQDVYIFHENKHFFAQTNVQGVASLAEFPKGNIFIQHPSYYQKSITYVGSDIHLKLKEKIITHSEVVVSANKWEQQEENISQQIISINRKDISFENPQTSADLLASSGQVFVQKSQLGGGSPKLRGFAANAVLLVVDGVRMNNAIFRGGNLQNVINIDANAVESTEVVYGPGSVIYGSDALGGVMDFHTISPVWSSGISGNAMLRYSSAANEKTGHLDVSVAKERFTFFHSTSYTSFDDLTSGGNRSKKYEGEFERKIFAERIAGEDQLVPNSAIDLQKFSGYDLFNTISKIKWRASDDMDIGYGFYYSTTSDIPRYDRLTEPLNNNPDSLASGDWYYGPQNWQMHSLKMSFYQANPFFEQLKITGAYQKFEESRNDRDFGDDRLRERTEQVAMYSLSTDLDKEFKDGSLFYGIDFYYNDVTSIAHRRNLETNETTPTSTRYPDGGSDYTSLGVYSSYIHRVNEKLALNGGLRFNYIGLNAQSNDPSAEQFDTEQIELDNHALTGSFGIAYRIKKGQKISYNLASGFRAPNVDDVGKIFELNEEVIVVPNPDLEPESTISNEIGYEIDKDGFFLQTNIFYSRLYDAIVRGPYQVNGSYQLEGREVRAQINTGEAEIYGASLMAQAELTENFAVVNAISFTNGTDLTNDQPLRHATPVFGRSSLIHRKHRFRSEFYIEYNSSKNPDQIPDAEFIDKSYLYTDFGSPAWYTLNLKSTYQINDHFNVNLGIENLLDKHYRPYTSGISAPGRNIIVALRGTI